MLMVTAGVRTHIVARKMPALLTASFPGVTVTQGKLHSNQGIVVPEPWRIADMSSLLNGRTQPTELYPDSLFVIDPAGKIRAPFLLTTDSLMLLGKKAKDGTHSYWMSVSWPEITRGFDIDFSETVTNEFFRSSKSPLFVTLLMSIILQTAGDFLNLWILLFLVILIYRRELAQVWPNKSTFKIILNGTIPYIILMPLFAVSGDHSELLVTAGAVVSTIVIARAFRFHRTVLFEASKKDLKS